MVRLLWLLLSGCLWAVMMFFLFDAEIRPYFEFQQPPTYRTLLRGKKDPELHFRDIRLGAQSIGQAESLTEPITGGGYSMKSRIIMRMQPLTGIMLPDDRIYLDSSVRVDLMYQLSQFTIEARFTGMPARIHGEREGDRLRLEYSFLSLKDQRLMDFPRDATLSDNFLPYTGGARLFEGKKWRMRLLDFDNLISLSPKDELGFSEVYAAVVAREPLEINGTTLPTFKVEVRKNPSDPVPAYTLWVDDEGGVLQQTMKLNKLLCTVVLVERRKLTPDEARVYDWRVKPPR